MIKSDEILFRKKLQEGHNLEDLVVDGTILQ